MNLYTLYKPLRNFTRQLSLIDSLAVLHAYFNFLQFRKPFPNDVEVSTSFLYPSSNHKRGIFEWELDLLVREIIINGSDCSRPKKSLRKWCDFASGINKIQRLENSISAVTPGLKENIYFELYRVFHRQFPWQRSPNASWLTRYFKIFSHPILDDLICNKIGLNTKELYTIGLSLTGLFLEKFCLFYSTEISLPNITNKKFENFLRHFSCDLNQLTEHMVRSQKINIDYAYSINPLRFFPLVEIYVDNKRAYISPIPTFLIWRFTEGIYYEICDDPQFGNPFGESFQKYTGEVIENTKHQGQVIYPEAEYHVRKNRKDTVDWILEEGESLLFVECKTKKIKTASKTTLLDTSSLEDDFDKMANSIVQLYKQIYDFNQGFYPCEFAGKIKNIFPIVVTISDWYAIGDKILTDVLDSKIQEKLSGLPEDMHRYNELYPYTICSIDEFEKAMRVMKSEGIFKFMSRKTEGEYKLWSVHSFMQNFHQDQLVGHRNLFPDDFEAIYRNQ